MSSIAPLCEKTCYLDIILMVLMDCAAGTALTERNLLSEKKEGQLFLKEAVITSMPRYLSILPPGKSLNTIPVSSVHSDMHDWV